MGKVPTLDKLLDGHVTLDVECFDRLCLNAYDTTLPPGGTVYFLTEHRGTPSLPRPCSAPS